MTFLIKSKIRWYDVRMPSPGSQPCNGRDFTLLTTFPASCCTSFHVDGFIFLCIWIFGYEKKSENDFIHIFQFRTNRIPKHQPSQSVAFFTSGRLNWSVEMASSWHTGGTSKHLLRCRQDCFALWGKQKYNLVARGVQSDIFLWDKGAWGHKVLFASTELDLFIILHEIARFWKF